VDKPSSELTTRTIPADNRLKGRFRIWWQAARYHFVAPSIFPATIGALVSWAVNYAFSTWYFLLVIAGVVVNHIALNMTDDYFDFKHAVDHLKAGEKNPYTGGSGTLTSGLITPQAMFRTFSVLYLMTLAIGLYLTRERGLPILAFTLFGIFCSIFYTAPPLRIAHRGLGELALLINFGATIGLGSYFAQAQQLSLEAFFATLPCGIMLFSMIIINEIPDLEEDRQAGKMTLIASYGRRTSIKLYGLSWAATYLLIVTGVAIRVLSPFALLALLSFPLTYRSLQVLREQYADPKRLAPANLAMIKAHALTSLLLIAAYAAEGLLHGADGIQLALLLLILSLFYLPAALPIVRAPRTT